jgi:hypothetical protein
MRAKALAVALFITCAAGCHRSPAPDKAKTTSQDSSGRASQSGGSTTGTSQLPARQSGSAQEAPLDVNAMYGNPPMNAEEVDLANKVREAILADPRIKSRRIYVGVTHKLNGNPRKDPVVTVAGRLFRETKYNVVPWTNDRHRNCLRR